MTWLWITILMLSGASILNTVGLALLLWRQRMLAKAVLNFVKGKGQ